MGNPDPERHPGHALVTIWRGCRFPLAFVALWSANEWHRTSPFGRGDDEPVIAPVRNPVLTEGIKLLLAVSYTAWHKRRTITKTAKIKSWDDVEAHEALPLTGASPDEHAHHASTSNREKPSHSPAMRISRTTASVFILLAAALFACYRRKIVVEEYALDRFTQYLIVSLASILTAGASYLFLSRTCSLSQAQSILLQVCGIFIIQSSIIGTPIPHTLIPFIAATILTTTIYFLCIEFIYTRIHSVSPGPLHVIFFTSTLLLSIIESGLHPASLAAAPELIPHASQVSYETVLASISQALVDLSVLASIYHYGATTATVLLSCGAAVYLFGLALIMHLLIGGLAAGCLLTLLATVVYLTYDAMYSQDARKGHPHWFIRSLGVICAVAASIWLLVVTPQSHEAAVASKNPYEGQSIVQTMVASQATCHRKPLPGATSYPGKRTYHAFDNVLLIIFFSHARYNVNLDYWRQVYAEFFPNVVFVGPGNREDLGFSHSYDVLVDTYESDEDLTSDPTFYKMAGRMAHHMLYTAMREYDCYDGYLWAPFDTLLNVPRLQQFDQRYFWYHSPFGQYVHNPALGDDATNRNSSRHAPPAKISPDPASRYYETWRHWGPDWWWGEPHVGVSVCMKAYEKVPLHMREHLASLTNGTRFIGGSADTLYIPGRHREVFMDTLGLFLETDCFLEIATPTAVHLASPPDDPILYVDHWWIWEEPLNATYVRQQWRSGFEVDTFHTFHWGDKGTDGVWRGNPRHIGDVRMLLRESAKRQDISWSWGDGPIDTGSHE